MNDAHICPICGGPLEEKSKQMEFHYQGKMVIIEGVPVQECKQCGEVLMSASTSKAIDSLLASEAKPVREIVVPVFPFRYAPNV